MNAWQMTRDEFEASLVASGERAEYGPGPYGVKVAHEDQVRQALRKGLDVPDQVMAEYPHLRRPAPKPMPAAARETPAPEAPRPEVFEETLRAIGEKWQAGKRISAEVTATCIPWPKLRLRLMGMGFKVPSRGKVQPQAEDPKPQEPQPEEPQPEEPAEVAALHPDCFERQTPAQATNLVTKYRPACLDEVLGQDAVVASLKTFAANPYPAAFLFHGESGTGKTSAAYALAHELGVAVEDGDIGGLFEIPSGSQSAEAVRKLLDTLCYRPLVGSGWRVCIVNECDRMSQPAETIWLDALEHLPPQTVVIFTTNNLQKLSRRFRDRCEVFGFTCHRDTIGPWIRALAQRVWEQEGGVGECPGLESIGLPTLGDLDNFHPSFRLALQQLQRTIRDRVQKNVHAS
jgi:hypothetical protein